MWGDGKQTRSFTFIDDCVEGILRIMKSDYREPLNLGSTEMVRDACVWRVGCVLDGGSWAVVVAVGAADK
jgi:dTDP-D-glucose 4,6-dehydratase